MATVSIFAIFCDMSQQVLREVVDILGKNSSYIKMVLITFMGYTTNPFQSFQLEYLTTRTG